MTKSDNIVIGEGIDIPFSEFSFEFSTSGGPGGQHANRSLTRVTLLFDVAGSPSLDESMRTRLREKINHRLTKEGVLRINVHESRSQRKNRETAVARLKEILEEALKEPKKRKKTRPSSTAIARRKADKKKRSQLKQDRRKNWSQER